MELHPPVGSARPVSVFRAPMITYWRPAHSYVMGALVIGPPTSVFHSVLPVAGSSATAYPEFDVNSNRPAVVRMPAAFP